MTPVVAEPLLGYRPCSIGFLTCRREPAEGQCQTGRLTGAVTSGDFVACRMSGVDAEERCCVFEG